MGRAHREEKSNINKRIFTGAIIIMAAVFLVTVLNLILLYRMLQQQVTELGTQNIENMQSNLQTVLDDASYMTRALGEEVQLMADEGASDQEIIDWIYMQSERQYNLTGGYCFNVCFTSPRLIVVPGYEVDDNFDINTRTWYGGALKAGVGEVYISEPYVDLASGKVCYTSVILLKDGVSTVSLDFTMDTTQSLIASLTGENREAIIINSDEILVGCADDAYLGSRLADRYPVYTDVFNNLENSSDTIGYIDNGGKAIFYCVTDNKWYLLYGIDKKELFGDTYVSMLRNVILSTVLLVAIVILLVINMRGHRRVKAALDDREKFFNNISGELKNPVNRIMVESNPENMENSIDVKENMKAIRESAMKLSGLVDNMLTYSGIQNIDKKVEKKKTGHARRQSMGNLGIFVISLLVLSIFIVGLFAWQMMDRQANSEMERNVETSSAELTNWMSGRKNATDMLAHTLEASPEIMEDYDAFVAYLDSICSDSDDITLIYVGNSSWDTSVVMSDGWIAESGYIVQAYTWYAQAVAEEAGYSVSQPFFDTTVRSYCITISRPLYDQDGVFLGVLGVDYSLDGITSEFVNKYSKNGYAFLTTDSGLIVNHPNREYAISTSNRVDIRSLNYYPALKKNGYIFIKDYDGVYRLCIARADDISGFSVVVLRNASEIFGTVSLISVIFILILVGCIVLVVLLGRRMAKWYVTTNEGLHEAVERATSADKAKMQFLAQISHELRTPINAVLGMDELIMRESSDNDILGYAADIQTAGHNLLELVNGLLDFSKIENGKMTLQEVEYNTSYMIKNTLNTVTERARKAGLELITDIDPKLPSLMYGDDLKVRQVVVNLLTNAIKYTPEGSVKLTVKLVDIADNEAKIYFSVKDTGIGIKPEDRDNLFKSFSRLDQEKNRSIEGTGLGLYIVNKILAMMNTKLELDSVYGEGSDFHFTIAQKVIDKLQLGSFDVENDSREKATPALAQRFLVAPEARVLVVDDNAVNLKVAQGLLKRNKLQIDVVESGTGCIEILESGKNYEIIFLDHMMPGMDGVETLKHIRNNGLVPKSTPVIVMTANAISGAKEEYIEQGFDDYISKPLDVSVLESILAKWLPKEKISYNESVGEAESKVKAGAEANTGIDTAASEGTGAEKDIEAAASVGTEVGAETDAADITTDENIDIFTFDGNDDVLSEDDKTYFAKELPEIDLNKGMSYASDSKMFYAEIAKELIKNKADEELQGYFDAGDFANYRIRVHAMKNNLRTIGATELGEEAFALETAAKEDRLDYIKEKHSEFNVKYSGVMNKIDKWLKDNNL